MRLIHPVSKGIYGMLGTQLVLTSNHQDSVRHFSEMDGITIFALDGGGFSVDIAAALGLLSEPKESDLRKYIETVGREVTFYIPLCLSSAWCWKDGDRKFGGNVCVKDDMFPDSKIRKLPPIFIRLYAAVRLAFAQLFLLFFPIAIMNIQAFIPTAVFLLAAAVIIAFLWNLLPVGGWLKGAGVGLITGMFIFALGYLRIFSFPLLFLVGVVLLAIWLGRQLIGARSFL